MLFLLGFLSAWLLWGLGWSEGGHLFELPADNPLRTHTMLAGALAIIGFAMAVVPRLFAGPRGVLPWLLGALFGLVACGLLQPISVGNGSGPGPWVLLAILPLLISKGRGQALESEDPPAPLLSLGTCLPVALGGLGLGLLLTAIATPITRMLPADGADNALMVVTFVGLTALSLWLLGAWLGRQEQEQETSRLLICLCLGGLVGALSLRSTASLTRPSGLREVVSLVGLDVSDAGTWGFDILITLVALGPLALLLGCLLHLARRGRLFLALFMGAAVGIAIEPLLTQAIAHPDASFASTWPTIAVIGGVCMALAGAIGHPQNLTIMAATCGGLALWWFAPGPAPVLKAWTRFASQPEWVVEYNVGEVAVIDGHEGSPRVTLDQRPLTGAGGREAIDALLMERSAQGLVMDRETPCALLVGQLDLPRSLGLIQLGFQRTDRTGFFSAAMPRLEGELFHHAPVGRIPGDILTPNAAWKRLQEGAYDLVVIPAIPERTAALPLLLDLESDTRVMAWLDAGAALARVQMPEQVLLVADGVFDLTVGVQLWGADREEDWFTPGPVTQNPMALQRLAQRPSTWPDLYRALMLERCALGEEDSDGAHPRADFLRSLAAILRSQEPSSPFESRAEAFEISKDQLIHLASAVRAGASGRFVKETMFGLARVLVEKRRIEAIQTLLAPISQAWGKPLELELALAAADMESLDAESALEHLEGLEGADPRIRSLREAARALQGVQGATNKR